VEDPINQSKSKVGGDQVGRDKITQINYGTPPIEAGFLIKEAVDAFKLEAAENVELGETISALQHFFVSVDLTEVRTLDAKLSVANRTDEIREAEQLKELFAMRVHRRQFSATAQGIFAYLLGRMNQLFKYRVRPLIARQATRDEIDKAVHDDVLIPILEIVQTHSLPLAPHEVQGMLYFLTGNCHITWH
jgi:hypothetical protein